MSVMTQLYGKRRYPPLHLPLSALTEIGSGSERSCFIDPLHPERVYKLSKPGCSEQTRREIAYFTFLKQRQVPFTHIPEFYGGFSCEGRVGIVQSYIASTDAVEVQPLDALLHQPKPEILLPPDKLQTAYLELKHYLLRYNVLPSDMYSHNLLLQRRRSDDALRLYLIDGLGSHVALPLNNFIRSLGARTILKHCRKFCTSVAKASGGRIILQP